VQLPGGAGTGPHEAISGLLTPENVTELMMVHSATPNGALCKAPSPLFYELMRIGINHVQNGV